MLIVGNSSTTSTEGGNLLSKSSVVVDVDFGLSCFLGGAFFFAFVFLSLLDCLLDIIEIVIYVYFGEEGRRFRILLEMGYMVLGTH